MSTSSLSLMSDVEGWPSKARASEAAFISASVLTTFASFVCHQLPEVLYHCKMIMIAEVQESADLRTLSVKLLWPVRFVCRSCSVWLLHGLPHSVQTRLSTCATR